MWHFFEPNNPHLNNPHRGEQGWVHDNFVQRWLSSISSSPVIFIAMTKSIATERNNGIGTFDSPMHS
ncbi:MAG: hypothetical protein ABFC86_02455, partial [Rectinema sp.]